MVDGNPIDLCIFWGNPPPQPSVWWFVWETWGREKSSEGTTLEKRSKDKTMFGFMLKWGYEFVSLPFAFLDSNLNTPKLFCAVYVYTYIR